MASLDSQRTQAKTAGWLLIVPQLLVVLFVLDLMPWRLSGGWLFALWFGTMVVAAVTVTVLSERYRASYKKEVVAPLLAQIDPSAIYEPNATFDPAVLDATGLFPRAPERHADDRVRGNLRGVPFQFGNVHLWRTVTRNDHNLRETLFRGLFLQLALPQAVNGLTCVIGDDTEPTPPKALRKGFTQVDLGLGDAFDAQFDVWSTDVSHAKAALTRDVAARLTEHAESSDYPPRMSFHDGFVSVAVTCIGRGRRSSGD